MRPFARGLVALGITLALAGCGGAGSTTAPAGTSAGSTTAPAGTTAAGDAPCTDGSGAAAVTAAMEGNQFQPATVNAKVGDVIEWTNGDAVPHSVVLDDGSCGTSANIRGGGTGSLVFSEAGSFPFHCGVHPSMKGTLVIT